MKNRIRILSVLMTLAMLFGLFALAIPAAAEEEARPIGLEKRKDVVVNGVTFRVDALAANTNSSVLINPNGTVTVRLKNGDMFWMPGVKIDEQSEATLKVSMPAGLDAAYSQQASGFTFNIKTAEEGVWGTAQTDECSTVAHRTARRLGIYGATLNSAITNGSFTKNYLHVQLDNTLYRNNNGFDIGDGCWGPGKTLITKTAVVDGEMNVTFINATGDTEKKIYTVTGSPTANGLEYTGAVGFFMDWASSKGYCDYTIEEFTIKNALVNGVRTDFDLLKTLAYDQITAPNMNFAGETKAIFEENDVELTFEFEVEESIPKTAELVVKRGDTEIARSALNTLQKGTVGYLWTTELTGVEKTELLSFSLEASGETVERTELTYGLGAAYQSYLDSLGEPISSDKLNAVSYSESFDGLNMTLVPGENIVNGQRWMYIRNSTDGVARISDGKLYISGNSNDRILFLDQVYDHINYRFSMSINYTEAPEKVTMENDQPIGANGYVGGIFNLQDADTSGDRNAVITAVTPDYLYLKQVVIKSDGTINPKDERGDCPIGTKAEDNLWSQYWSAVQPGSTFYLYTYSGISGFSNGNFCSIPRDMSLNSKGWGNCYGVSKDYRTGVMGIFLGEGQASAYIDDIQVEVAGTLIKVDGEDFPIWGDGEISIADLQRKGEKLLYAIVDGVVKSPNETINATRKTKITTVQVTLSTRKVVAVGETGLKWRTEIGKAEYDRLKSDENVKSIQLGTVVVPTSMISAGLTRETSGISDIAAASEWSATSETTYTFEGVRTVAKAERDTSYSGVGYLTVIMQDDTVFTVYADYVTRNHAYALSDLVSEFHDPEDEPASASDQQGTTPAGNDPAVQNETTPEQSGKKKGCGSTVGTSAFFLLIALSGMCVVIRKKKERERS